MSVMRLGPFVTRVYLLGPLTSSGLFKPLRESGYGAALIRFSDSYPLKAGIGLSSYVSV
jgi:hypothetical protein